MLIMKTLEAFWRQAQADRMVLLALAAVLVGVAISIDGDSRRFVNGIGGIIWIAAAARITVRAFGIGVDRMQLVLVLSTILVLSVLVRPTDIAWALIGFGWGGVLVGFVGRERGSVLGALLAAWWLPAHLLIAISRSVIRELSDQPTTLRSDPPPTAILVPLVMVLAAWVFSVLAANWRTAREDGRLLVPRSPVRPKRSTDL
jgi:hypothetical protein